MKKAMDKLLNNIKFDKKYVFFSLIIIILGIITGALFIVILNSQDKSLVIEYIQSFINDIKNIKYNYFNLFKHIIFINYITIIIISIIGFTYIFSFFNILILFYKAFVLGFSISSFILTYKIKGLLISFAYIFPHLVLNILIFSLLTAFTLKISTNMIKYIIKKKEVNMRRYFNKYIYVIIFSIILITISSLYETFISTILIKNLAKIL